MSPEARHVVDRPVEARERTNESQESEQSREPQTAYGWDESDEVDPVSAEIGTPIVGSGYPRSELDCKDDRDDRLNHCDSRVDRNARVLDGETDRDVEDRQ